MRQNIKYLYAHVCYYIYLLSSISIVLYWKLRFKTTFKIVILKDPVLYEELQRIYVGRTMIGNNYIWCKLAIWKTDINNVRNYKLFLHFLHFWGHPVFTKSQNMCNLVLLGCNIFPNYENTNKYWFKVLK